MVRSPLFKKFILLILLISLAGCDSYFGSGPIDENIAEETNDDEPIVVDPLDETGQEDPKNFGVSDSFCYGFSVPTQDLAEIDIEIDFPESHDLSSFLPPVGSQGEQGSCVAWATGYYLKSFQENLEDSNNGEIELKNQMSPAFIYNQIKVGSCADGSSIPTALELISGTGIVTWREMPYDQNECDTQPTDNQNILAEDNQIISFAPLNGNILFDQAKAFLLNNQPIVIAISIDYPFFGKFEENGDAVYREFGGEDDIDGAHAMLVVGYDDTKNAFKVVNSWGKGWGNEGFVWIDYKAFQEVMDTDSDFNILCEAWVTEDLIDNNI